LSGHPLEVIAEAIPHIVWLADGTGATDYFNERGTAFTGLPRQRNYGWRWLELVHPDDAPRARAGWEAAARTATPYELSYRLRRCDGVYRWHACRALPVPGPSGVTRWIGTADELPDPSEAAAGADDEARIARQVEQLRKLLAHAETAPTQRFGHVPDGELARRVDDLLRSDPAPAPAPAEEAVASLRPRDLKVAGLVGRGHTNVEIANLLGVSLRTVEASRSRLRHALGLRTRADIVRFARERELSGDALVSQTTAWPAVGS